MIANKHFSNLFGLFHAGTVSLKMKPRRSDVLQYFFAKLFVVRKRSEPIVEKDGGSNDLFGIF